MVSSTSSQLLSKEERKSNFRQELKKFEDCVRLKANLIADGVNVHESVSQQNSFNTKQIHLYQHHVKAHTAATPEDLILYSGSNDINKKIVTKVRYNPDSEWILTYDEGFRLNHQRLGFELPVQATAKTGFESYSINGAPLSNIVQKLGVDVAGVIISNYCFYFNTKKECRFCEIHQTYKNHKTYKKVSKSSEDIVEGLKLAFQIDPDLKFILLNSGNITSYDHTNIEFIKIAKGIKAMKEERDLDLIGILMPPDNFSLIDEMKSAGFDKVYYDVEVFDPNLFSAIAPGKADYGYKKLFDALEYARDVFGKGSSYTSFIYGIQHLPENLDTSQWNPSLENQKCIEAVEGILAKDIVPLFCVYHYSGYNQIGSIKLDAEALFEFSCIYGEKVHASGVIPESRDSVVYNSTSVTNTLLNDGYNLTKLKDNLENDV